MALLPLRIDRRAWGFLKQPGKYVREFGEREGYRLRPEPTARQMRTAAAILNRFRSGKQYGVLLADDVGLGKTAVAALVACVFAGRGKRVRVLAPNKVMARRWREEIARHLIPLEKVAHLLDHKMLRKALHRLHNSPERLRNGRIDVSTHIRSLKTDRYDCDLLIVDEAHRARSEASNFANRLRRRRHRTKRMLILTATPFSIHLSDLRRMLQLIGADEEVLRATDGFGRALDELWTGEFGDPVTFGEELAQKARAAVKKLRPWVIRHSLKQIPKERNEFGKEDIWRVDVRQASDGTVEAIIRADRMLQLGKKTGAWKQARTNDPRFHEGWDHLRQVVCKLGKPGPRAPIERGAQVGLSHHHGWLRRYLRKQESHPKMEACADAIRAKVAEGEKVLVFCDHHATAQELKRDLERHLVPRRSGQEPSTDVWRKAWRLCLKQEGLKAWADGNRSHENLPRNAKTLFSNYIAWLSCGSLSQQVANWLERVSSSPKALACELRRARARRVRGAESVAYEAAKLFKRLVASESRSTRATLGVGAKRLPGWGEKQVLVISSSDPPSGNGAKHSYQAEPDTLMTVFNSPFGPEVLVTTDRLSEGVDLHGCCRHLMHYELDPSPIRTMQRNGRVRRVGSWASRTRKPILISYPALPQTRDVQLVKIMGRRLQQFDLLLGGVTLPVDEHILDETIQKQQDALCVARNKLERLSLALPRR